MRTVRFLVPLAVAALGLLALPSVATADPYPLGSPQLVADPSTITVGSTVHVSGSGFGAVENVNVDHVFTNAVGPAAGTLVPVAYTGVSRRAQVVVTTDANGNFEVDLALDQVGLAVITATGLTSGVSASVTVRILAAGARLPVTGQSGTALRIGLIGSAVAAAGVVLLVLVRSRRRRVGTHSG